MVDRDVARERIALQAGIIVAEEGLRALTIRSIAAASGTSRAIVRTYFENMDDLLRVTFDMGAVRQGLRWDEAEAKGGGLHGCLESLLPLDREGMRDWKVILAFLGASFSDPELAAIETAHLESARDRVLRLLLLETREPKATAATRYLAQCVLAMVVGIAIQAVYEGTPPARQLKALREGLRPHLT